MRSNVSLCFCCCCILPVNEIEIFTSIEVQLRNLELAESGRFFQFDHCQQQILRTLNELVERLNTGCLAYSDFTDDQDKFMKLVKNRKRNNSEVKVDAFRNDAKTRLFDTSACKWLFEVCSCDKNRKVPPAEQAFLHDQ